MTGTDSTQAIVEEFLRRAGGDGGDPSELFADEVDHEVAGSPAVPWTGRRGRRDEVREFFALLGAHLEPRRFSVRSTLVDGADAVVLGDFAFTVRASGRPFEGEFALHLAVESGQIVRYRMYEDSYALAEAMR